MIVYICVCGGPKRASDPLELELKTAVSLHVDSGNQKRVLRKSNQCSQLLSNFSGPKNFERNKAKTILYTQNVNINTLFLYNKEHYIPET